MVWCLWMRRNLSYLSLFVAQVEMLNFLSKIWKYSVRWLQYEWRMSKIIVRCVYAVFFSNSVSFTRDRLSVFLIKCIISVTHLCSVSKYRQVTNWSYHDSNPARWWNSKKPFSLHRSFLFFSLKLVFLNSLFCLRNESLLHFSAKWWNFEWSMATLWV